MKIWKREITLEEINQRGEKTMVEHLGIQITEIGVDYLRGEMPVEARTHQPQGILHGGASVAFAESLASLAGNYCLDDGAYAVGLEINANHLRSVRSGMVTGTARPIHIGRSTQVWETRIEQDSKLICVSRMTLAVLQKG